MTNLTEQWKRGKLPCGWHYIKIADTVFIDFFEGKVWKNKKDKYIDEVLAEVPSYDGYMTLIRAYNNVVDKNIKLKELLKRARKHLSEQDTPYSLIKKINQVLGEE